MVTPDVQSELEAHRVIAISGRRQFAADIEKRLGNGSVALRVRNLQVALVVIQSGIGIGPQYRFVGDNEVNLVRVLAAEPEIEMDIWLTALPELKGKCTHSRLVRLSRLHFRSAEKSVCLVHHMN